MAGLEGRVVVVSGAARGMGRAYVSAFAEQGARIAALDRSWSDVESLPPGALAVTCDVTRAADVERACALVQERFGAVDVLINNAAMRQRDLFPPHGASTVLDASDADWQSMLETNVVGVLRLTRGMAQPMLRQRRGSIVNISSRGSVTTSVADGVWGSAGGLARNQPYDASKAALTNLSFYLAEELRPHNIAVNVVFPAGTRTTRLGRNGGGPPRPGPDGRRAAATRARGAAGGVPGAARRQRRDGESVRRGGLEQRPRPRQSQRVACIAIT